jgi:FkbM family methyltransferase
MPLTKERFWLDWDSSLSVIGHEPEIKDTYQAFLKSPEAPELFVDIGANYGTHSLLFLVHGIETLTFEPNTSCHGCFREMCHLNHVTPRLEPVALGDREGLVELIYPERETWLGSINTGVVGSLVSSQGTVRQPVELKRLDDYLSQIQRKRTLIKIDTEGNELAVLRGAMKVLREVRPAVVFECMGSGERTEVFAFFDAIHYRIYGLPWNPMRKDGALESSHFQASPALNFIAVPTTV